MDFVPRRSESGRQAEGLFVQAAALKAELQTTELKRGTSASNFCRLLCGESHLRSCEVRDGRFSFRALSTATSVSRLDKWLWAVRVFKTRSSAAAACRAGSVHINEQPAKPAREVRMGEQVTVQQGLVKRSLRVLGVPGSRVGAKLVPDYCADLTPKEEFEKARLQPVQQFLAREKGSGRPTKRDRRLLDQLLSS